MSLNRMMVIGIFVFSATIVQADAPSGEIIGGWDFQQLLANQIIGGNDTKTPKLSADGKSALLTYYIDPVLGTQDGIYDFTSKSFTPIQEADSSGVLQRVKSLYDYSANGSTVVGQGINSEAITWTKSTGVTPLTGLSGETITGYASQVSSDGSIIYGWNSATSSAFRWTATEGFTDPFAGSAPAGGIRVTGATADGDALVGINPTTNLLYYWSEPNGIELISNSTGYAPTISSDGSTYAYALQSSPFTYVSSDSGNTSVFAVLPLWLNDDGSLMFAQRHPAISNTGGGATIFDQIGYKVWVEGQATTLFLDYYISTLGYDIPVQYNLGPIFDVSDDGKTLLVGGSYQGYNYAVIHVPEVSSLVMLGAGGLILIVGAMVRGRRVAHGRQ